MTRSQRLRKIWRDPWFLALSPINKLVIEFLRAHCDPAGVWQYDKSDLELKVGFHNNDPVFSHPQIRGLEFSTRELAEEDAEARGLSPEKVKPKELAKWSSIVAAINKRPKDFEGDIVPQIEIIGEGRWWFVRFIELEFGNTAFKRKPTIHLDESNKRHGPAIQSLRANALMARFKSYYPDATIRELGQDSGIVYGNGPEQITDSRIPTMEAVLNAPEGSTLPPTERKLFWMRHNNNEWEGVEDWRALLTGEEKRWMVKFKFSALTALPWPETKGQRKTALDAIESKIADAAANRIEINGQMRMTEESKQRIQTLTNAKNLIEKEGN
jgi:hypothetical protein